MISISKMDTYGTSQTVGEKRHGVNFTLSMRTYSADSSDSINSIISKKENGNNPS